MDLEAALDGIRQRHQARKDNYLRFGYAGQWTQQDKDIDWLITDRARFQNEATEEHLKDHDDGFDPDGCATCAWLAGEPV
jgi:hypothetical protein